MLVTAVTLQLFDMFGVCRLPWIELGAGIMLVVGFRTRAAALMIVGMMVMFMVALYLALQAGLDMSCGCFASSAAGEEDAISWNTMWRDAGWLAIALYVLAFDSKPLGLDRVLFRAKPQGTANEISGIEEQRHEE